MPRTLYVVEVSWECPPRARCICASRIADDLCAPACPCCRNPPPGERRCAGGVDAHLALHLPTSDTPAVLEHIVMVSVSGCLGGHSGCAIHEGRANAIHVLARTLLQVATHRHCTPSFRSLAPVNQTIENQAPSPTIATPVAFVSFDMSAQRRRHMEAAWDRIRKKKLAELIRASRRAHNLSVPCGELRGA